MRVIRSAKPYWIYLILTGKKKLEIGKDFPKSDDWDKTVEMYCSKDKKSFNLIPEKDREWMRKYLGKIACKFTCDEIVEFLVFENKSVQNWNYFDLEQSCLTYEQIGNYVGANKKGYAWHISDLKVYDNPKELSEFVGVCRKSCLNCKYVKYLDGLCDERGTYKFAGPPQSWCYAGNMKTVSLKETETRLREWLEGLLKTHTDYKPDMPFDLKFVAECIWGKVENDYSRLEELEYKLESGQLVELPCKVGDTMYGIAPPLHIEKAKMSEICYEVVTKDGHHVIGHLGVSLFTDKAQAEARLKELQENS